MEQARVRQTSVDCSTVIGLRDRAILVTLAYTTCRAGAVAKLRLGDFQFDGSQFVLRFQEKGGKSREIPVRHDLEGFIRAYMQAAGIAGEPKDRPLCRVGNAVSPFMQRQTGGEVNQKDFGHLDSGSDVWESGMEG